MPGLAQPLKCVSVFTAGSFGAGMPSGSMWTSTSRTDGNFRAHLVFHLVADVDANSPPSSAGPPRRACPRKTGSPSCARNIFPRRPRREWSPATARIFSMSSRSGERSINSLNAGRSSRQPLKAMTHAGHQRRPVVRRLRSLCRRSARC